MKVLIHLEFDARDAKVNGGRILDHLDLLQTILDRQVKFITSVCDYFCKVSQTLKSPTMIKLKVQGKPKHTLTLMG